ncbi:hypothetical protein EMPS_01554 [Entomortierella parvispora]|uniref:Reverse transcriptase domain-containing protein n=1 Tax=Entomortierella parvispora TaxID=205924 RepID=A0A9P3H3S2_9FUNG|nr:hypothetical protein EMPS_01554 [Entomortierella parvispora]
MSNGSPQNTSPAPVPQNTGEDSSGISAEATPVVSNPLESHSSILALNNSGSPSPVPTSAFAGFAELLRSSAPMEVDGAPPVSRIAQLESLVVRKQQRVDELAEQREDVLLKAEELINASPPAEQPSLVVQHDLMLTDLADKLKQANADLEVAREALNRRRPLIFPTATSLAQETSQLQVHSSLSRHPVDLTSQLKNVEKKDFEAKFVEVIFTFLDRFEKFLRERLIELFDPLAWRYVSVALQTVEMDRRFDSQMELIKNPLDRTWVQVEKAIKTIFCLDMINGDLLERVFTFKALPQENSETFACRFEGLLGASGIADARGNTDFPQSLLVGVLYRAVPDNVQNLALSHFNRLSDIKDYDALLTFIRNTSNTLQGTYPWGGFWAASQWAPHLIKQDGTKGHSSHSASHGGSKRQRSPSPAPRDRRSSCKQHKQKGKSDRSSPRLPDGEKWCTNPPCTTLTKQHWDSSCRRHSNNRTPASSGTPTSESSNSNGSSNSTFAHKNKQNSSNYSKRHNAAINRLIEGEADDDDPIPDFGLKIDDIDDNEDTKGLDHDYSTKTVLANPDHVNPTCITTQAVQVGCNGRALNYQLDVMKLDSYDCYLGMDLFSRLGFSISGIQFKRPDLLHDNVESDKKPSIVSSTRPDHENSEEFKSQRQDFLSAIGAPLAENAAINPQSCCPHPSMKVHLTTKDGATVFQRSSKPFSQSQKGEVDAQISKWLNDGVIVPAPHGTPHMNKLTMAARHDLEGNLLKNRVCLDPRHLNSLLEDTDNFTLPQVADILEKAAGHRFFSTLDLFQAYHRLALTKESQPLTAFMHNGKQYMFARAPFGLKPMTSIFQRGMSLILGDLPFVAVYVDDIVIFSDTAEEHREHVREVIKRLTKANLILNPDKYELRFRRGSFELSPLQPECFTQIKELISRAPVLSFPDFTQPFYVATDASNLGLGTVLDKRRKTAAVTTRREFRPTVPENNDQTLSVSSEQLGNNLSDPPAPFVHQMQLAEDAMTIPKESERSDLLQKTHGDAHLGANAMVSALHLQKLTWPKLKDACLSFIRKCTACQHFNIARKEYHPLKAVHATFPGEHLAIDLAQFQQSSNNHVYALVVVDVVVLLQWVGDRS